MSIEIIDKTDLDNAVAPILDEIRELRRQLDRILNRPDETVLTDKTAAAKIKKSVATLQRMKTDGRIGYVNTAVGRMCRVCDVENYNRKSVAASVDG